MATNLQDGGWRPKEPSLVDEVAERIRPHVRYLITKKGYRELEARGKTPKDSEDLVVKEILELVKTKLLEGLPEKDDWKVMPRGEPYQLGYKEGFNACHKDVTATIKSLLEGKSESS